MELLKLLRDVALTLAVLSLLSAALSSRGRVIRASAQLVQEPAPAKRKSEASIDQLMFKVKQNLETRPNLVEGGSRAARQQQVAPGGQAESGEHSLHNSYHFYANKTAHHKQTSPPPTGYQHTAQSGDLHGPPQEVHVRFLRRAGAGNGVHKQPTGGQQRPHESANVSLYLLNVPSSAVEPGWGNALDDQQVEEQQQPPPFALLPQGPAQPQNAHFMQPQPNGIGLAHNNIRQILNNYQRYPQSQQLANNLQQQLSNLQQRVPAAAAPTPPRQQASRTPSAASQQPQAQQLAQWSVERPAPLNPFQLLAAPFQAFLPPALATGRPGEARAAGAAPQAPNQQAPPGLFGNPFGAGSANQAPPTLAGGLENLYQQLPIYQALLAARQRQEAMQAAHRARQQQQLPAVNSQTPNNNQPFAGLFAPYMQQQAPVQAQPQPQPQPPPLPQPPAPPTQPPAAPEAQPPEPAAPQPEEQPQGVQFDDDQANNNDNQIDDQRDNAGQQQPADDQSGPESNNGGGADPDEAAKAQAAEEEDPDLKQFQNLANGGDSFTDLFPLGILSNNDISDIKKQQQEQARKQEQEERARAAQQARRPISVGATGVAPPTDEGARGSGSPDAGAGQQSAANQADENNGPANSEHNNEEPGSAGQQDEPEESGDDDADHEEEPADEGSPTAAALTSKSTDTRQRPSSSASEHEKSARPTERRLARSPGVVYSSEV